MDFFDDVPSNNRHEENSVKLNSKDTQYAFHLHKDKEIEKVQLRGSNISSQHQELLIRLKSGVLIRISRNNCEDTFQIGAAEMYAGKKPDVLQERVPYRKITCKDAFEIFGNYHRCWPRYEQADCHQFAQHIMKDLFPGENLNLPDTMDDDDFM